MHAMLFTDVDKTLLHAQNGEGTQAVEPTHYPYSHFSQRAHILLQAYRLPANLLALVTSRRAKGCTGIIALAQPDYVVVENGCVILHNGAIDEDWQQAFADIIGTPANKQGHLWDVEAALRSAGYTTDSQGKYASFRVFRDKPDNMSEKEKQELEARVEELAGGVGVTTIRHQNMIDVIPSGGGKANAMRYLLARTDTQQAHTLALGDDYNDRDMLALSAWAGCPAHTPQPLQDLVRAQGGYVSPFTSHKGTEDLLEQVCKKTQGL